ncbi:hypothetical protein ACS0TY_024221 [Phlomoides rotata]
MEHHSTTSRAEAERLLGIAEKLLRNKDFSGCRDFAILAQETEPLLEGSDQILAVAEVLLAADNKRLSNNQPDWYSILQVQRSDEPELIKKQYRRLALLLHPDKNKFPFSDSAFRLVADSWAVLSDPAKKSVYDNEFAARFTKVDLVPTKQHHQFKKGRGDNSNQKLPVRRSGRSGGEAGDDAEIRVSKRHGDGGGADSGWTGNFWTACPYCYNLYEYPKQYEGCCLRCDSEKCKRAFTAAEILSMPPLVPGREAYYCCWGFFPMGFAARDAAAFPKWMPPMFEGGDDGDGGGGTPTPAPAPAPVPAPAPAPAPVAVAPETVTPVNVEVGASSEKRKRGRPKKKF